jgi:type II secretory pathway component PulF
MFLYTDAGKLLLNRIQINLPGGVGKDVYMARFANTLGMLLQSGTPIIDAVKITGDVMNNVIYKKSLENIALQLERGIPMSVPLEKDENFPLVIPQMVLVGEQTGRLDQVLDNLAKYYQTQSEDKIKGISTLFEPVLIVIIGLGVGFIVFAIIMPIYQVVQLQ